MTTINILVLSAGRRLFLAECLQKELRSKGKVITADSCNTAPALYSANEGFVIPAINHANYLDAVKQICKQEKITAILSLIDPELSLIAKHSSEFNKLGVRTIVSDHEVCETWLDKYAAFEFLVAHGFRCAKTYDSWPDFESAFQNKEVEFPVFIKPRRGSASLNTNKANNIKEASAIFHASGSWIIQELLGGQELGVDVYVDLISRKVVSIFVKEKLAMRAGETDKGRSIKSEALFNLVEQLVILAGLIGPVDIDIFSANGEFYISEINPRFGGGYPLAYACGENFPRYIINNLKGLENEPSIGAYEEDIYMMKHDTMTIKSVRDLK